ncbi:PREDICTED: protoporphyrinogen oxidase isoform X2 [Dinoponera quadriceps]|uniref:Protoporphyrinogen oxidase n=2 Tax=Dinoponera quadriceps TaxID=609295 RepID=A0A6P3WVA6_DINQU|nr:PREDICTED: protoporphyrinogen oxidase isoform X2 [Dinoponera quadriceps]
MTVVLGGGISGLSAAYYAANEARLASVTLLEASDRVGGWIRSRRSPSGAIFEQGPRTVRPHGPAGMNTLDMIDDLQLTHKLIRINASHPIAQNRLIYSEQALHMLPMSLKGLFKTISLLDRPLVNCLWTDLKAPKVSKEDESIYSFVQRRLGRDIADRLISPIICGVCAGDARQISVNFMMKSLFEAEQKHGSIVKGFLAKKLKKVFSRSKSKETKEARAINDATMGRVVQLEKLAIWSLEGGLEQLPLALADNLEKRGVTMETGTKCERLTFKADRVELSASGDVREYSRVISSLPAKSLAELLQEQHPELSAELRAIPSVTVAVVNLEYPGDVLPLQAFGFLIPPEENLPLLGVIFDSCMVPKESATSTVLTIMMGGAWFEKHFGPNPTEERLLKTAVDGVKDILYITEEPVAHHVAVLRDCIPQHVVGHVQRVKRIHDYISTHNIPLALCGSSYEGVGINDVILSAKQAVRDVKQ